MTAQAFPATIQTFVLNEGAVKIYYPQVYGMVDTAAQQTINQQIIQLTQHVIQLQYQKQQVSRFDQMIGTFEIKNNQRNYLSLTVSNYAIASQHANGLSIMKSATFDVRTGEKIQLPELFKPHSNFIDVLSEHVKAQIKARNIPVIGDFKGITENQDFYIADRTLVLYFQPIELTPHYFGFPIFPISVYSLTNIIDDSSALAAMATNS